MIAGLVKGEGFAVDATVIEADASRIMVKPLTSWIGRISSASDARWPDADARAAAASGDDNNMTSPRSATGRP
jgi:hypothetical protein